MLVLSNLDPIIRQRQYQKLEQEFQFTWSGSMAKKTFWQGKWYQTWGDYWIFGAFMKQKYILRGQYLIIGQSKYLSMKFLMFGYIKIWASVPSYFCEEKKLVDIRCNYCDSGSHISCIHFLFTLPIPVYSNLENFYSVTECFCMIYWLSNWTLTGSVNFCDISRQIHLEMFEISNCHFLPFSNNQTCKSC